MTIPAAQLSLANSVYQYGWVDIYRSNRQECLGDQNIGGTAKEDEYVGYHVL